MKPRAQVARILAKEWSDAPAADLRQPRYWEPLAGVICDRIAVQLIKTIEDAAALLDPISDQREIHTMHAVARSIRKHLAS
jgi:hypothetical protein